MKILDRYLLRSFAGPFGVCIAIFCILVMLGRFFDKMSVFNEYQASPMHVFKFLLWGLPFWLNMVLPIATMLALLFSLGHLQMGNELTAMRSAGISPGRLYRPYLLAGLALSIMSLIGGLTTLPRLNFESRTIYRVDIKKRQVIDYRKDNVVASGKDNRRFTIGWLDIDKGSMQKVVIDRLDDQERLLETVVAQEAIFQGSGRWLFRNGVIRRYPDGQLEKARDKPFKETILLIQERPVDFALVDKQMDDMTGRELLRQITRLDTLGAPSHRERVAFHMRIALPFANLVVIALSIPLAMKSKQRNRAQTFSYAFGIAFLFWGSASVWQSIGEQGHLPAWMVAWMSNVIFLAFAFWRMRRVSIG